MRAKSMVLSPAALVLSFAAHAAVVAAALTLAWREPGGPPPGAPLPVATVEIVVTAPDGDARRPAAPVAAEGTKSLAETGRRPAVPLAARDVPRPKPAPAAPDEAAGTEAAGQVTVAGPPPVADDDDGPRVAPSMPEDASIGSGLEPIAQAPPAAEMATKPPVDAVEAPEGTAPAVSVGESAHRPPPSKGRADQLASFAHSPSPGGRGADSPVENGRGKGDSSGDPVPRMKIGAVALAIPGPRAAESGRDASGGTTGVVAAAGNPRPDYPWVARRKGLEGKVVLRVAVLPSGAPSSVTIETSSSHGVLDRAALETVERWRFVPATRWGRPVEAVVRVPVTFRLEE